MQKQIILLAFSFLAMNAANAQTKIKDGTVTSTSTPKSGAILDLESNNKALLLPRVSLTNTEVWGLAGTAPTEGGYEVYNTSASMVGTTNYPIISGGVGVYYWNGVAWVAAVTVEPWNNLGTTNQANANTQNIYQQGRVLVGFPSTYAGTTAGSTNSVIGQNFNVMNNLGVSRLGTASNMVLFRAEGSSFATPGNTASTGSFASELYLGNLLFEGYSDGKRTASASPANYGQGRVGVAQVRSTSRNTFTDDASSWGDLQFMTKGIGGNPSAGSLSTRMTIDPLGNVGIGTATTYKNPQNRLVVEGPVNLTSGTVLSSEFDRSGVRLDNVKNASYLGTNADGDIIRVTTAPATTFNVTSEKTSSYTVVATDDFVKLNINTAGQTLSLPTAGIPLGKKIYVSNIGLQNMALSPLPRNSSYNTIQGGESVTYIYIGGTGNGSWDRVSGY